MGRFAILLIAFTGMASGQRSGYLSGAAIPDILKIVPAAPPAGSPQDTADRAIFRATRSLQESNPARWALARNDDALSIAALLADFRCALGLTLTNASAPRTVALLTRVSSDSGTAIGPARTKYQRQRPFLVDEGPVCIMLTPAFERTPDYPSGHTTLGWVVGLILAELAPDHATDVLARARAFGESRVVCGVHNASAVEAGRVSGAALAAALHGSDAFRSDLDAAKAEIAALRRSGPPPASTEPDCAAESTLIATSPY